MPMTDIKAVLLNCTLKKSPEVSHTEGLMKIVIGHLHDLGVETELIRPVDYNIPFGVESDLGDGDEWPQILEKILAADILIMGMSIWFGVRNSVSQMVIERLDGTYNSTNEVGQYPMYNKVGGVVVTGNEDGAHAAAETTVFNLTHLGFTIPPERRHLLGRRRRPGTLVPRRRRREAPLHAQDSRLDGAQRRAHGAHPEGQSDPARGQHGAQADDGRDGLRHGLGTGEADGPRPDGRHGRRTGRSFARSALVEGAQGLTAETLSAPRARAPRP